MRISYGHGSYSRSIPATDNSRVSPICILNPSLNILWSLVSNFTFYFAYFYYAHFCLRRRSFRCVCAVSESDTLNSAAILKIDKTSLLCPPLVARFQYNLSGWCRVTCRLRWYDCLCSSWTRRSCCGGAILLPVLDWVTPLPSKGHKLNLQTKFRRHIPINGWEI